MRIFDPVHWRILPPNLITAAGMSLGFVSLASAASGEYMTAAWCIALAALVDKLDGSVARLLKASSEFGVQFDSFSDFCTFGLSPAALVWFASRGIEGSPWAEAAGAQPGTSTWLLGAICTLYAVLAAVRLARFNVTTSEHPTMFQGLPTTLAGSMTALAFLSLQDFGLLDAQAVRWAPWLLAVNAALMVSSLPLPKLALPASLPARLFFFVNIVGVYLLVPMRVAYSSTYGLLLLLGYVLVGFVQGLRADASPADAVTP